MRLRFAAVAVLALLGVEGAVRAVEPRLDPVYEWPRHDYMSHEVGLQARADELRLLVVGSSSVGRAISPDGLATEGGPGPGYNYWLAGPSMRSISLLTTDVLLERTDPSIVVIGISMREFQDGPAARDHLQALEQAPAFRAATDRSSWVDLLDDRLRDVSATARHRETLRDPVNLVAELRRPAPRPGRLGPDGFMVERGDNQVHDEPPEHTAQEERIMADYRVAQSDLDALAQLLGVLHDRGITALVVNLPVTDRFLALGGDDGYDAYLRGVETTSAEHSAHFLDALAARIWSDADFGDMNHLNDRGAERLQPVILDAIAAAVEG